MSVHGLLTTSQPHTTTTVNEVHHNARLNWDGLYKIYCTTDTNTVNSINLVGLNLVFY